MGGRRSTLQLSASLGPGSGGEPLPPRELGLGLAAGAMGSEPPWPGETDAAGSARRLGGSSQGLRGGNIKGPSKLGPLQDNV